MIQGELSGLPIEARLFLQSSQLRHICEGLGGGQNTPAITVWYPNGIPVVFPWYFHGIRHSHIIPHPPHYSSWH
eukprot:s1936_g11.t1